MRNLFMPAVSIALALGGASCAPPNAPAGPYFAAVDSSAILPGMPISNTVPIMTDIWGRTVEAPGMDLSHGGSTTQSLGVEPPGSATDVSPN